jgi:DGQHR domain-containing protein
VICTCCGAEIRGSYHGPYRRLSGVTDYACDQCWNNPSISFPDKVTDFSAPNDTAKASVPPSGRAETTLQSDVVRVSAVALRQGSVTAYVGKMKSVDILALYDLKRWSQVQLDGYQRGIYEERKREIASYLRNCSIPVVPAILVSIRGNSRFVARDGEDVGILEIPKRRGSIVLIDGQHRVSGFEWYAEQLMETRAGGSGAGLDRLDSMRILHYEVPVLFLDSESAAKVLEKDRDQSFEGKKVMAEDVERVVFYTLNKTQRGIAPSLKDILQLFIQKSGMRGIPAIQHEAWRVDAAEIGYRMNVEPSPMEGMINLSGASGMGPVQLNSFVTSMKPLFALEAFQNLNPEAKYDFIKSYWSVLRRLFREGFEDHANHILLKSIGIYSLNWLAADIYDWCRTKNVPLTENCILRFLRPLRNFNWCTKAPNSSPLKAFGGSGGVRQAYRILLKKLAKGGISEAKKRLKAVDQNQ